MPARTVSNWWSRRSTWLTMLVMMVCAAGCSPLTMGNRCMVNEPMPACAPSDTPPSNPESAPLCGSPEGVCTCGACPPVCSKPWPRPRLPRLPHLHGLLWCFGPLFHWGESAEDAATVEAELFPPHSRFHPVPTAPVFAQRAEYIPPEQMMQAVPERPLPQLTPPLHPVPSHTIPSHASPMPMEPGPLFVPSADAPAEAIPPGSTNVHRSTGGEDIRDYESEGRRPGGIRLSRS